MKKELLIIILLIGITSCTLCKKEEREKLPAITDVSLLPYTPVSNQGRSQTCWAYTMASLLESDLLASGKDTTRLSVMYMVREKYLSQFEAFYYSKGREEIRGGSLGHTFLNVWKRKGALPLEAYSGHLPNAKRHDHRALLKALKGLAKKAVNKRDLPFYRREAELLLDKFMGKVPDTFIYKGESYTPQSFAESLGINPDQYVELTSFTHHPYNDWFVLEVPDNWEHAPYYNLPLDELVDCVKQALSNGQTVAWDGDISEKGFDIDTGLAITSSHPITSEERQKGFEYFETTDDHMMHMIGIAHDEENRFYFVLKNSWGKRGSHKGLIYMSEDYFRAKTISVILPEKYVPFIKQEIKSVF